MKKLIASLIAVSILAGCTKETLTEKRAKPEVLTFDEDAKESSSVKAQKFVQQAEKLLSPNGFMYAYEVLERAYELDPTNFKVQFYMRLLKPMVLYKGFYLRIQPIVEKMDEFDRAKVNSVMDLIPTGSLKSFLMAEGGSALEDEEDLQKFALQLDVAFKEFRLFLKKEKSTIATINLVGMTQQIPYLRRCIVNRLGPKSFQVMPCQYAYTLTFTLDSGDFEALQQMSAGMQMVLKSINAYQLNGLIDVVNKHSKHYHDPAFLLKGGEYFEAFYYGYGDTVIDPKNSNYFTIYNPFKSDGQDRYQEELLYMYDGDGDGAIDEEFDADGDGKVDPEIIARDNPEDALEMERAKRLSDLELLKRMQSDYGMYTDAYAKVFFQRHPNYLSPHYYVALKNYSLLSPLNMKKNKDLADRLRARGRFGKLKPNHSLKFFEEFGPELLSAYKWADKYQDYLCPEGVRMEDNRPGRLFSYGICTKEPTPGKTLAYSMDKMFGLFELNLSGQNLNIKYNKYDDHMNPEKATRIVEKVMNPAALFRTPVQDLKKIIPYYNDCDQPTKVDDPTVGGVYPNGDAIDKASGECKF